MQKAIQRKQNFPELFSGYDLVAQEDLGRPLTDLAPELLWFQSQMESLNLQMPFFFHAGECLGTGNDTDHNLFDAILLGTRRIGHGFSLYKHPLLIDLVKEKKILVESCPISNEVLRLCGSVMSHPLPALLARGVAVRTRFISALVPTIAFIQLSKHIPYFVMRSFGSNPSILLLSRLQETTHRTKK